MSKTSATGTIGEDIAERFLARKGYLVLERNYRKFHGEIDIIAKDRDVMVFVEVKTISVAVDTDVTRETYRPEYNIDKNKIDVVSRTAELYLHEKHFDNDWRIDVVAVELNKESRQATVRHLKSIYL